MSTRAMIFYYDGLKIHQWRRLTDGGVTTAIDLLRKLNSRQTTNKDLEYLLACDNIYQYEGNFTEGCKIMGDAQFLYVYIEATDKLYQANWMPCVRDDYKTELEILIADIRRCAESSYLGLEEVTNKFLPEYRIGDPYRNYILPRGSASIADAFIFTFHNKIL